MTTPRLCTSFKTREQLRQTKLGNQARKRNRCWNTWYSLSADYKRCSVRRAARLSFGRFRRPVLAATSAKMQAQHQHRDLNRTNLEAEI